MKRIVLVVMAVLVVTGQAQALEFWHSGTVWAGQGQCSANFTFDAGALSDQIRNLKVSADLLEKGKVVGASIIEVASIGGSEADRYATGFIEGEDVCSDNIVIRVTKATAVVNGKQVNLIKTKDISARNFKPFAITIAGGKK
jgi:hypothetical protein